MNTPEGQTVSTEEYQPGGLQGSKGSDSHPAGTTSYNGRFFVVFLNQLIFVMVKSCVFFAVWTESLYIYFS
jgi:hypothetical protein